MAIPSGYVGSAKLRPWSLTSPPCLLQNLVEAQCRGGWCPWGYGGPSCSTYVGVRLRETPECGGRVSSPSHSMSCFGSFCGRLAFIGNAVRGKFNVLFKLSILGIIFLLLASVSVTEIIPPARNAPRELTNHMCPVKYRLNVTMDWSACQPMLLQASIRAAGESYPLRYRLLV